MVYDCIIVGGGIAGLQAAIQLGRYQHKTLVIDANQGRSTICQCYHNLLGWPNGVSGPQLRQIGRQQAAALDVQFVDDEVIESSPCAEGFLLQAKTGASYAAKRILMATGIVDNIPSWPDIYPCLGISIYVCPDCDGFEIAHRRALVLGAGSVGAHMALTLTYFTNELVYINHGQTEVEMSLQDQLQDAGIEYISAPIQSLLTEGPHLQGVILQTGQRIEAEHAFVAFGGNQVKSGLAAQLGVNLHKNKHILVDPRTKMTNVPNVWAAGDVVAHSEQVSIAMGEGVQAAIWIHKSLIK
ncbi:NAD(P)/FAD-dependent oxidoreductase [Alicyclobacillus fodiniaquatilis]|jgi:thioredoxin reductase|uniref:NAD(P)/FAD-dependent oxidoreductase n=1 Tax=Alicyclobacillus fodiniaquatilis TaxID=1661150 RepID=A0ABW4JC61_9BACL